MEQILKTEKTEAQSYTQEQSTFKARLEYTGRKIQKTIGKINYNKGIAF